jgi:RNA polymerase sigma factor (sigma-70 family)
LAQALRTGETTALPEIYDFYAPRLFDYAHALLRDEDLAADAIHDSLIATQEHIAKLREPERFRSWLYAIVRNECLRLLAEPERRQGHEAAERPDDAFIDAEERQRRDENRRLVLSALGGLAGRHREAIDLSARHDLSAEELASVVGKSSQQATELVADAREELETALAAAIIARTGRSDCPSVAALVDQYQWPLSAEVCRKLIRHIESCPTCRERRKRKVSTTRLMQILPAAAMPSDLRMAVLSLAQAGDQHENRTRIAQRAEPFDVWGWPTSLDRVRVPRAQNRTTPRLWPAVGAAACVVAVVGAIFFVTTGGSSKPLADPSPGDAGPTAAVDPSDFPSPSDSVMPTPPTPTPTPTPKQSSHTPTPKPSTHRPPPPPPPTHRPSPKPTPPGTLAVSGCSMDIGDDSCSITVTAQGGPVTWSVRSADSGLSASGGGKLKKGESTTIEVHRDSPCPGSGSGLVGFSPGGSATVTWTCVL